MNPKLRNPRRRPTFILFWREPPTRKFASIIVQTVFALLPMIFVSNCWSQGQVFSSNKGVLAGPDHFVYSDFVGGTKLVTANFAAELYYGPYGTDESSLTPLPSSIGTFGPPDTPFPGTWVGRQVSLPIGGVDIPIT